MKLESGEYGLGFMALTIAPILVLSGYVIGIISIFHGTIRTVKWKSEMPFLIGGWVVFFISLIIYILTLEETASLWDCSEFIACAYKLQVPHAPGAPLFLMIGRIFSLLSLGNRMEVAFWVNMTSAMSSALAVMFTFWSVVMLGRRLKSKATDFTLILAGAIGAFSIAFADSFWYSAVEAETYAMAALFIAINFWAILKWTQVKDQTIAGKWLIFMLYSLGLSVGVHPMSLLVLPALALIIVFKYHYFSWKYLLIGVSFGAISILFLNHVVLFGLPDALKYFDIFFVNKLNFPFYSGAIIFCVLLIVAGFFGYKWSIKNQKKIIGLSIIGLMYFLIGYSSYFMIIIRSQANTSIDENNPENLVSFASYLKRESYGTRPFLYGPHFTGKVKSYKQGSPVYILAEDKYEISDYKVEYEYDKADKTIFPRIYSNQQYHIDTYRQWTGLKEGQKPKFMDNLNFMFNYQVGHMYLRYLMFNFSGRASDIQHAEWLSPLNMFKQLPLSLDENKARNNFLMMPLLLGIIGMIFQYRSDRKGFWAVMALFLFLGLILVFYLNATPNEPRERDYIYVGSYLAFAIWCGIGVIGIMEFLDKRKMSGIKVLGGLTILVPLLLLYEGYDDHDRSGRTLQVDHARNTLESCAPNAILFTGGDNDTFPLWYVQEVEGFRTDVRVIVLSYFNAEWYIDQMKRKVYESESLPFSLQNKHYKQGGLNDILPYVENPGVKGAINLHRYLDLIGSENKALQVSMSAGTKYNSIPSKIFYLNIDKNFILSKEIVPQEFQNNIPDRWDISWKGNFMEKSALMVLDLIANNNWERPLYFNLTSLNSISLDLKKHVLQEGPVYRLLPIKLDEQGAVNSDAMYSNLIDKSEFRDLDNENVYYNHEDYQLRILQNIKANYNALTFDLLENNQYEKAGKVVNFLYSKLQGENIQLDHTSISTAELLFRLGEKEKAKLLAESLFEKAESLLEYYSAQNQLDES
ncbi:MAG: DUF2723 domain-containing protein, partial [Cyclobacteriaceae bacterium]|nr:DUF2723 domain-containing protein [Cyclobacteriaceae bacterium]